MAKAHRKSTCILIVLSVVTLVSAQENYLFRIGRPVFSAEQSVELGVLNIPNGNLHLEIPLFSLPQRGGQTITGAFVYDSHIWRVFDQGQPLGNIWHTDNG